MFKLRDEVIDLKYGYYGWQPRESKGGDIEIDKWKDMTRELEIEINKKRKRKHVVMSLEYFFLTHLGIPTIGEGNRVDLDFEQITQESQH